MIREGTVSRLFHRRRWLLLDHRRFLYLLRLVALLDGNMLRMLQGADWVAYPEWAWILAEKLDFISGLTEGDTG